MNKHILASLMLTGACTMAGQAQAYTTWTCLGEKEKWSNTTQTMRGASNSFPSGSWRDSLSTAIDRVNQNPSPLRWNKSWGDTSVGVDNGQNEAWFTSDQNLLDGAPARAFIQWDCIDYWIFGKDVEFTEADIIFDNGWNYTTSMSKSNLNAYAGSSRPFQTTAIHEMGHASGLAHTNNTYNIMGQDWDHITANGSTARSYLGEDAAHGLVYLYGTTGSSAEDLAVTHFKRTGASGEYSSHSKTRVTNSSGGSLSTVSINGETGYRVNKGQSVRLELTYENNGKTQQTSADVRYYVSTNDYISTYDTQIGSHTYNLGRNTVYTTNKTLTIPSNLNSGQNYWIGAVIDADGSLSEMTESNNATYLPIRIN